MMSAPPVADAPGSPVTPGAKLAARLAAPMFTLAAVYLLAVAGLVHRADTVHVTGAELHVILGTLIILWPVFAAEAVLGFLHRDRTRPARSAALRVLAVCLFPPVRLGLVQPSTGMVWLPRLGWQPPGRGLLARLDRGFGLPLLVFALLVLPVLGVEYFWADAVRASAVFAAVLHVTMAAIWVAFAVEFILKVQASGRPAEYAREKWVDLAIVVLPTLEFVLTMWAEAAPVARLLRTARAVAPDQLARMGRAYRLRGLLVKGWHAVLALGLLARLTGDAPKRRLHQLEERIDALEDELADLRRQADAVRDEQAKAAPAAGVGGGRR